MSRRTLSSNLITISVTTALLILVYNIFGIFKTLPSALTGSSLPRSENTFARILSLDQNDHRLWDYIRQHHMLPPSKKQYNLNKAHGHGNKFTELIEEIFNSKTDGVFIEVGAYDGESYSNSLDLEQKGWEGILIECNPQTMPELLSKNRKAWISDVCLSPLNTPKILEFQTLVDYPQSARLGRELTPEEMRRFSLDKLKNTTWVHYEIPCFPLYSIIQAIGKFDSIDFLSLDVEGVELEVLKHFPFEKMDIKVIIVEIHFYSVEERMEIRKLMADKGYRLKKDLFYDYAFSRDNLL